MSGERSHRRGRFRASNFQLDLHNDRLKDTPVGACRVKTEFTQGVARSRDTFANLMLSSRWLRVRSTKLYEKKGKLQLEDCQSLFSKYQMHSQF